MLYRICDLLLESNTPIPELPRGVTGRFSCRFRLLHAGNAFQGDHHWFHHCYVEQDDSKPWLSIAKAKTSYHLRFSDLADFFVSIDGEEVCCRPWPGTPLKTVRHLLIDQVIPMLMSYRGHLTVHASSVVMHGGAVVFVGATGQGKSTLATSFAIDGFPFLTDDFFVLDVTKEQLLIIPSYPGARLWDDSIHSLFDSAPSTDGVAHYSSKKRLVMHDGYVRFNSERTPLSRVYCLDSADKYQTYGAVTIEPLSASGAFMELVAATYKLDITDETALKREFYALERLVSLPIFYRLSFPHDFAMLPAVRRAILDHLRDA